MLNAWASLILARFEANTSGEVRWLFGLPRNSTQIEVAIPRFFAEFLEVHGYSAAADPHAAAEDDEIRWAELFSKMAHRLANLSRGLRVKLLDQLNVLHQDQDPTQPLNIDLVLEWLRDPDAHSNGIDLPQLLPKEEADFFTSMDNLISGSFADESIAQDIFLLCQTATQYVLRLKQFPVVERGANTQPSSAQSSDHKKRDSRGQPKAAAEETALPAAAERGRPDYYIRAKRPTDELPTVLFCFEAKAFDACTRKMHNANEKVCTCDLLHVQEDYADDPRMQAIQRGFVLFGDLDIGCAGFCVAPTADMATHPDGPAAPVASASQEADEDVTDQRATAPLRHERMVFGWILLDRSKYTKGVPTMGYRFVRDEQAVNFKDGDTVNRDSYVNASIDLTDKAQVRQHILNPFIKMIVLMQHQWLLLYPPPPKTRE